MPSDLQRVAQGLVECLDEVPAVVIHLQRTAERCRENAALAVAASQGRATVAAQQLDAAARACEEAAHYLSMAPPKAKAWATRLVGGGSSRPDALSADRNRTTGGSGDAAERDLFGRTKRLSFPFKPADSTSDAPEPPLIKVARKALEKLRKQQEKDEKAREEADKEREDAFEFEIEVTADGRAVVVEDQEQPEDRDYKIAVDINEAATELLQAMSATPTTTWQSATITITPERVAATFTYEDLPEQKPPPIIDVELPDHPPAEESREPSPIAVEAIEVGLDGAADFDPAFDLRPLGVDFAPGVHDPHNEFSPEERSIADRLSEEGWRVDARPADHGAWRKNPDATIRWSGADEGEAVEFKTPTSSGPNALKSAMSRAGKQADLVVIDGRPTKVTEEGAGRAYRRCRGQPGTTVPKLIQVILGDGRLISYSRSIDGGE
ncbi:hypothetical protein [Kribbella sp. NPDC006257]|uniref:hypothetical protein n=1 Tax=Kribbella sp. NPDC006257 TaxID=3156738 RepID=UPI0033BF8913